MERFPLSEEVFLWWNSMWPIFGGRPQKKAVRLYEFESDGIGLPVTGFYALPAGAKEKSLPAILFTPGSGIRGADRYKPSFAAGSIGFLSMDISAHGLPADLPPQAYSSILNDKIGYYDTFGKGLTGAPEEMYLVEMYLRFLRALDVLCSLPEWDGKNLIVCGSSQGGALALACTALDRRVSLACIGVPAFGDPLLDQQIKTLLFRCGGLACESAGTGKTEPVLHCRCESGKTNPDQDDLGGGVSGYFMHSRIGLCRV